MSILNKLKQEKVVAVIRGNSKEEALLISNKCIQGGMNAIEVTFTTPNAELVIEELSKTNPLIGAGTVLNKKMCELAITHGAKYIVSPGFDQESAEYCLTQDVPYIPGCMTITEMMNAMNHGVKLIKLFPGSVFGPDYIKAVKGPLPNIEIMPTGGVSLDNMKEWFDAGVVAVGIGGALTKPAKTNEYDKIEEIASNYVKKAQEVSNG